MTRSHFIGSLIAIVFAPFKNKEPVLYKSPDFHRLMASYNVPTSDIRSFERATFTNCEEKQTELLNELHVKYGSFTIKGSDLVGKLEERKFLRG